MLPDACVDVVFSGGRLVVAGPATAATVAPATPGQARVGVRFRVGAAGAALGLPARRAARPGRAARRALGPAPRGRSRTASLAAPTRDDALLALIGGVAARLPAPEDADHEVRRAALALARPPAARRGRRRQRPRRRASASASCAAASSAAVGYGPATLARVLRFQRFLRRADAPRRRRAARPPRRRRRATPTRPTSPASAAASPASRRPRCSPPAPRPPASRRAARATMADLVQGAGRAMRDAASMTDLAAAAQFIHGNGRLLERRRFEHLFGDAGRRRRPARGRGLPATPTAASGFMEPDLRTPASQPSAVLYAFEVAGGDRRTPRAGHRVRRRGAGLDRRRSPTPTAASRSSCRPPRATPHAPWWAPADDPPSSLLMTAGVAAAALPARPRRTRGWPRPPTTSGTRSATSSSATPTAFRYAVHFLDAVPDRARADAELDGARASACPTTGSCRVEAGVEGERSRALEVAPRPDHAGRAPLPATR